MEAVAHAFVAFVNVKSAIAITKLSPANFASVTTSRALATTIACVPDPIKARVNVVNVSASPTGPETIVVVQLRT